MRDRGELARQAIEAFNADFADTSAASSDRMRGFFVEEPVIVPMRAALEGIEYRGPDAVERFRSASVESWTHLRIEPHETRQIDDETMLMVGTLIGVGRETGAETRAELGWLVEFEGDRIRALRTFPSVEAALAAGRA